MNRCLIVHGTEATPADNWFPWLRTQLEQRGWLVAAPQFPTPKGQTLANWTKTLNALKFPLDEDTALVGHSAGAAFILRALERLKRPVRSAHAVAGFTRLLPDPEFTPRIQTFVDKPWDWARVRSGAKKIFVYHGRDDPYVPFEQAEEIARETRATFRVFEKAGHLNAGTGWLTFPELLEDILASAGPART